MKDRLKNNKIYEKAPEVYDKFIEVDSEILEKDFRGREIAKQLVQSLGSISANIEEGYGRGFGKEYAHFLRMSRGSARESKGWYRRSKAFLTKEVIEERTKELDEIISTLVSAVNKLEDRKI